MQTVFFYGLLKIFINDEDGCIVRMEDKLSGHDAQRLVGILYSQRYLAAAHHAARQHWLSLHGAD